MRLIERKSDVADRPQVHHIIRKFPKLSLTWSWTIDGYLNNDITYCENFVHKLQDTESKRVAIITLFSFCYSLRNTGVPSFDKSHISLSFTNEYWSKVAKMSHKFEDQSEVQ